jgi:hypothetical protein
MNVLQLREPSTASDLENLVSLPSRSQHSMLRLLPPGSTASVVQRVIPGQEHNKASRAVAFPSGKDTRPIITQHPDRTSPQQVR